MSAVMVERLPRSLSWSLPDAPRMTTEEAIGALFPERIIERVKGAAADPHAARDVRPVGSFTEDRCRTYLEHLRWPGGVRCPRCDASTGIARIESRGQLECGACGYQFSVRVGTTFHASHLPLWKWFVAVYVIGESQDGISANHLKDMLGISYKTAWYLTHRVRAAMKDDSSASPPEVNDVDEVARLRMGHKAKHLAAFQSERVFRERNRGNEYLFRDMVSRLIGMEAMPYTQLIASA